MSASDLEIAPGEALGRSRGRFSTKIHIQVEGKGRPKALHLSEGKVHESTQMKATLDRVRVPRPGKGFNWPVGDQAGTTVASDKDSTGL